MCLVNSSVTAINKYVSPLKTNRKTFVSVTEDCMLLGVGVIAVGAYILNVTNWEQVISYYNISFL